MSEPKASWSPSQDERRDMIQVAAYHIAQRSGFTNNPQACWEAGEAQIDHMLSLRENQHKFQALVDSALDAVVMIDIQGCIREWNPQAERLFGWPREEALGQNIETLIIPPQLREQHAQGMQRYLASGDSRMMNRLVETRAINRDGLEFDIELTVTEIRAEGEREFSAFIRDISERKRIEAVQNARIRLMEYAASHTLKELLVATLDEAGVLTGSPIGFYHFLEPDQKTLTLQAWSTRTTREFCHAEGEDRHYNVDEAGVWVECIRQGRPVIHNDYAALPDKRGLPEGHAQVLREMVVPVYRNGLIVSILGVGNKPVPYDHHDLETISLLADLAWDFAETKRMEAVLKDMANYDALTGLPNRRMFYDRLDLEMHKANRNKSSLALLFLDLDRFKEVNDTLGHEMGDLLLKEATARIASCVRESDTVSRLGGDEFTIIIADIHDPGSIERIADQILKKLAAPFALGDEVAYVTGSIGITMYPHDADSIEDLMKNADQAMYAAKQQGRDCYHYFTPFMQESAKLRAQISRELRSAIDKQQLRVHFQPVIELASGRIRKAEALVRWQHPTIGLVSPAAFIPIAEETGMITPIGDWVFKQAAQQVARWRKTHPDFQVSVNKSPLQFVERPNSTDWFLYLKQMGMSGHGIVVEITEGLLADSAINDKLLEFRDAGIEVALDDFGTGYSSLSYLQKFDIDYLKIDQSFTKNLMPDSNDLSLCEAIIVMAHKLGIKVIAEGIETEQQRQLLLAAGCDYGQGYLFSRPVPVEEFDRLLT